MWRVLEAKCPGEEECFIGTKFQKLDLEGTEIVLLKKKKGDRVEDLVVANMVKFLVSDKRDYMQPQSYSKRRKGRSFDNKAQVHQWPVSKCSGHCYKARASPGHPILEAPVLGVERQPLGVEHPFPVTRKLSAS
ncbi:hypothetical protein VIGAN_10070700 [Vigna angularis var. angularis]|uniref:Uncharacterized protein n=1 Tax=Vigna angularis var. angularis TaxID=157739 RepID=A0A0S3T2Q3_PHAAN|nr:hypothetical protein VIGAN_10070700 [Vigna angularis var. angularis]